MAELCKNVKVLSLENHWNALYLKPRTERKVKEILSRKGFECYLPLYTIKKKYSDRIKNVEEPLLKSYIFVKSQEDKNPDILRTDGVLNYVYNSCSKKLAIIKQAELDAIGSVLKNNIFEEGDIKNLEIGSKFELKGTPFQNMNGTIIEIKKKKLRLVIEELGFVWEVNIKE